MEPASRTIAVNRPVLPAIPVRLLAVCSRGDEASLLTKHYEPQPQLWPTPFSTTYGYHKRAIMTPMIGLTIAQACSELKDPEGDRNGKSGPDLDGSGLRRSAKQLCRRHNHYCSTIHGDISPFFPALEQCVDIAMNRCHKS